MDLLNEPILNEVVLDVRYGKHSKVLVFEDRVRKIYKKVFFSNFIKELEALKKLKNFSFIPRIFSYNEKELYIEIERVEGISFISLLKKYRKNLLSKEIILKIFKLLFKICFLMDIEGVYKDEWNRPFKHVIFYDRGVKIIDFDRSSFYSQKMNISQFLSFCFNFFNVESSGYFVKRLSLFYSNQISFYRKMGKKLKI